MLHLRRPVVLLIGLLTAISIALIAGVSVTQAKTALLQSKIEQALSITMENLAPQWPRIETHSSSDPQVYYVPLVTPVQEFELYRHALEYLNQDGSVPPVKVTQVSATYEYGTAEDTLVSQAYVEFPVVLGLEKNLVVRATIKTPHYQTKNLSETSAP